MKLNKKGIAIPVILAFVLFSTMLFMGLQLMSTREKAIDYSESIKLKNEFLAKGFTNIILLKIMKLPMEFRDAWAWYSANASQKTIEFLQNTKPYNKPVPIYLTKFMEPFNFVANNVFTNTGSISGSSSFDFDISNKDIFKNKFQCSITMESDPNQTRNDVLVIKTKSAMMFMDRTRTYKSDGSSTMNEEKRITSTYTKKIKLNWYKTN